MDFGKVLSRAWQITWRWKILWVLGFLASLGQGWGNSSPTYQFSGQEFDMQGWQFQEPPEAIWAAISGFVLVLVCVFFILAIVLWVVSIIARGALIAGVVQVEDEGKTSFGQAWAVGFRRFWTLFGLSILAALPLIVLVILGAILFGIGIATGVSLLEVQEAAGVGTIVASSLFLACLLCCGLIVLGVVLDQIRVYGERAAILEGLGWIDAFQRGWQVIRENLGPTIVLWVIFLVLGLVIGAIAVGLGLLLITPFLVLVGVSDESVLSFVPFLCGGLIGLILFALVRSVVTTFVSASWTLAYRELTARPATTAVEAVAA